MKEYSEEDQLLTTAVIGVEAERFRSTRVGRKMEDRARAKIANAQNALVTVEPTDTEKIRALQNEAKLGAMFLTWLDDLIHDGQQAEEDIQKESRTD